MCRRYLLLAFLFPVMSVFYAMGLRFTDNQWLPTGVALPRIASVQGTTWAIAVDGRLFRYEYNRSPWIYFDTGQWREWTQSGAGSVLGVHVGPWRQLSVVETDKAIWYYGGRHEAEIPQLPDGPRQVGTMFVCGEKAQADVVFVATKSQIAFFYPYKASWQIRSLELPVSLPMVASFCTLFSSVNGELQFATVTVKAAGYSPDFNTLSVTQGSLSGSQPDLVQALASSGDYAWALTKSGDAYQLSKPLDRDALWTKLPRPPRLARPLLISGTDGHGFSPAWDHIDLWLADEGTQALYWLSREAQAWVPFRFSGEPTPETLASISISYEGPAGTEVNRLALMDGRLYHQRPSGGQLFVLIVDSLFLALITSILIGIPMVVPRRPTTRSSRLGGPPQVVS